MLLIAFLFVIFINGLYFLADRLAQTIINYADHTNLSTGSYNIFQLLTESHNFFNRAIVPNSHKTIAILFYQKLQ